MVVSTKLATLHECKTIYGIEDCYDMLEIARVDIHNREAFAEDNRRQAELNRTAARI